jgi:hypothetical protein
MARRTRDGGSRPRGGEQPPAVRWSSLLDEWSRSGLTQAEYCRRKGVSAGGLSWWKRKLGVRDQGTAAAPAFVRVHVRRETRPGLVRHLGQRVPPVSDEERSVIEIILSGGVRVRVAGDCDGAGLERVLAALERRGC